MQCYIISLKSNQHQRNYLPGTMRIDFSETHVSWRGSVSGFQVGESKVRQITGVLLDGSCESVESRTLRRKSGSSLFEQTLSYVHTLIVAPRHSSKIWSLMEWSITLKLTTTLKFFKVHESNPWNDLQYSLNALNFLPCCLWFPFVCRQLSTSRSLMVVTQRKHIK